MEYRCVATSVEGFVQQLAVAYITHGYWFYVAGEIPEHKDPAAVDRKLIERYGIAISKWARCRRKKRGLANMQYLRYERFFVLLATKGKHEFFERERESFLDVRRKPIQFAGYSIGCRKGRDGRWHASVGIARESLHELIAYFELKGSTYSRPAIISALQALPYERYAPVVRQLFQLRRIVNRTRHTAGLECLPVECVPWRRQICQPFGNRTVADVKAASLLAMAKVNDERHLLTNKNDARCPRLPARPGNSLPPSSILNVLGNLADLCLAGHSL